MHENVIAAENEHEQRTIDKYKDDAINTSDTQINKAENNVENCEQPKQTRRPVEKRKVVNSEETLSDFQPTLLCSQCMAKSVGNPFIANTRHAIGPSFERSSC